VHRAGDLELILIFYMPLGGFRFDPRHTREGQLGGCTETFFMYFLMKKHDFYMFLSKKRNKKTFLWHPPAGPLVYDEGQNETRPKNQY